MSIKTVDIQPNAQGMFECPECANGPNPRSFSDRSHLGIHRRGHGIERSTHQNHNPNYRPPAIEPTKIAQIFALKKQGLRTGMIAAQLGISVSSVHKYFTRVRGSSKRGRPFGSVNKRGPYKLKQPIVERAPEPANPVTLMERIKAVEVRLLSIQKAIGLE